MNDNDTVTAPAGFPIVGIGASAGGLAALEHFLAHIPPASGLAFVIVQHLAPDRKDMMVELLQRACAMPVVQVTDQIRVEPNRVYVMPPGRDMCLLHGALHLLDLTVNGGLHLPIDFFFQSLAADQRQNSVGVILSGMGSDGTRGLAAIREASGCCFVQDPDTAQCDGMPRSAIDAGLADVVANADELPGKILTFIAHLQRGVVVPTDVSTVPGEDGFLDKVIVLLRSAKEHDFSLYKRSTIARRVERRMALHQLRLASEYLRYLRETPQEAEALFNDLLIGVTRFFRDADVWHQLKSEVLPALLARHAQGAPVRVWVAGCSTGEEAYSLAIAVREVLEERPSDQRLMVKIFATDLDKTAIETARVGSYTEAIRSEVSEQRLNRFFVKVPGGYRLDSEVREMVTFAEHNIIVDPPFTKLDLLSCRNLLIYLEPELQSKLTRLFHYSLDSQGFLVLGADEFLGTQAALFEPLSVDVPIYRSLEAPAHPLPDGFPSAFAESRHKSWSAATTQPRAAGSVPNLKEMVERIVVAQYAPAAVLVNHQGDVLYFSGKTGTYLEPPSGMPNLNLFSMARTGLGQALSEVFHRAIRTGRLCTLGSVGIADTGATHYVDVVVEPLKEPKELQGLMLVLFKDAVPPGNSNAVSQETLVEQLNQSRIEANCTREEMEDAQQKLKLAKQELQCSVEELQAINEELITSKEEQVAMNEKMQKGNVILLAKVAELSRLNDDMRNLLDSTEIATLFLDDTLHVRRFTPQATRVFRLIADDIGRPLSDIACDLNYPTKEDDLRDVLQTLVPIERVLPTGDGRWYKVRCTPCRAHEGRVDGLVLTFVDITDSHGLS